MDVSVVAKSVAAFEVLFQVSRPVIRKLTPLICTKEALNDGKSAKKLIALGPSYVVSLCMSIFISTRGIAAIFKFLPYPQTVRMSYAAASASGDSALLALWDGVLTTNEIFISYLVNDVVHLAVTWPHLGGLDTVAHHVLFLYCSFVCGHYRLYGFPCAWLLVGELSTILLNLRWFIIKAGHGATRAMSVTNNLFAVSFFCCRIVLYAVWLPDLIIHFRLGAAGGAPIGFLWSIRVLIAAAFALDCFWMFGIVKMGLKKPSERDARPAKASPKAE